MTDTCFGGLALFNELDGDDRFRSNFWSESNLFSQLAPEQLAVAEPVKVWRRGGWEQTSDKAGKTGGVDQAGKVEDGVGHRLLLQLGAQPDLQLPILPLLLL